MDIHLCHARNCGAPVRPELFMCRTHWMMVPADLRRLIWRHYRRGQEVDKNPSMEYLEVAKKAQDAVQRREFEACFQNHGTECECWKRPKNFEALQGQLL
jgi:hypothetical protein